MAGINLRQWASNLYKPKQKPESGADLIKWRHCHYDMQWADFVTDMFLSQYLYITVACLWQIYALLSYTYTTRNYLQLNIHRVPLSEISPPPSALPIWALLIFLNDPVPVQQGQGIDWRGVHENDTIKRRNDQTITRVSIKFWLDVYWFLFSAVYCQLMHYNFNVISWFQEKKIHNQKCASETFNYFFIIRHLGRKNYLYL